MVWPPCGPVPAAGTHSKFLGRLQHSDDCGLVRFDRSDTSHHPWLAVKVLFTVHQLWPCEKTMAAALWAHHMKYYRWRPDRLKLLADWQSKLAEAAGWLAVQTGWSCWLIGSPNWLKLLADWQSETVYSVGAGTERERSQMYLSLTAVCPNPNGEALWWVFPALVPGIDPHSEHRFLAPSSKLSDLVTPLKGHSVSMQLSTDAVSALRKVWVLIRLWKQPCAQAPM